MHYNVVQGCARCSIDQSCAVPHVQEICFIPRSISIWTDSLFVPEVLFSSSGRAGCSGRGLRTASCVFAGDSTFGIFTQPLEGPVKQITDQITILQGLQ